MGNIDNIELVGGPDEFSLEYSKASGPAIHQPELYIRITSKDGMAVPEEVRLTINMIQRNITQNADALTMMLKGFLSIYESDKREDLKNIKLVKKDGAIISTYQDEDGDDVTETFRGKTIGYTYSGANDVSHFFVDLQVEANNKLTYKEITLIKNGQLVTISISYQTVGNVIFPRQFIFRDGETPYIAITIDLTNCTSD